MAIPISAERPSLCFRRAAYERAAVFMARLQREWRPGAAVQ